MYWFPSLYTAHGIYVTVCIIITVGLYAGFHHSTKHYFQPWTYCASCDIGKVPIFLLFVLGLFVLGFFWFSGVSVIAITVSCSRRWWFFSSAVTTALPWRWRSGDWKEGWGRVDMGRGGVQGSSPRPLKQNVLKGLNLCPFYQRQKARTKWSVYRHERKVTTLEVAEVGTAFWYRCQGTCEQGCDSLLW